LECRDCPRLADFLDEVKRDHPAYHARPVMPFGDDHPRLLIVGLAPGMHGANRTGRPFTGDHAGILLYATLHQFGYASQPTGAEPDDGLVLTGCRITNAVKCLPPQNKPGPAEVKTCNRHLKSEIAGLKPGTALLALGGIAHNAVLTALGLKKTAYVFAHGERHALPDVAGFPAGLALYDSYHCSRYNTNTRRLTPAMFEAVFARIAQDRETPCRT